MTVPSPAKRGNASRAVPIFSFDGFADIHSSVRNAIDERLDLEGICSGEWLDWYALTPQERWSESQKLWATYLALGGSLDPEPDTQSPFYDAEASGESVAHGRAGLRVVRRSGV